MPDTQSTQSADSITFPEDEIARYLGDDTPTDDHTLGDIHTAVRVISRYEQGDPLRNQMMVLGAMGNILSWAHDYGVIVHESDIEVI